jgi:NADH-quinone oxidoreductase subunit E
LFSWTEVECLGACVNAPMAQINKDYYEDLTAENFARILKDLKAGRSVMPGPQNGRQTSAPEGGPITLLDPTLYANEEPEEEPEPVGAGAALTDHDAKRPGKAANVRERAVPKPPLGKGRKPKGA